MGAGGPLFLLPGAQQVQAGLPHGDRVPRGAREVPGRRHRRAPRGDGEGGNFGPDHGASEASVLHLPEDDEEGQGLLGDLRPHRRAHHHQLGEGLLLGPGRGAHAVAPHARPLQRLHRHAEVQHVPVAAHDGHGAGRTSPGGADPHRGDAPQLRVRRGGPLALQGDRRLAPRRRRQPGRPAGVAAPDGGLAGRDRGLPRVLEIAEDGPRRHGGLRVHAEGRGHELARRFHAGGLRLRHPHRGGQPLRGRQGERLHRASVLPAAGGRPRGGAHPEEREPLPRLAEHREDALGPQQDPLLLLEDHPLRRHADGPRHARARDAQARAGAIQRPVDAGAEAGGRGARLQRPR